MWIIWWLIIINIQKNTYDDLEDTDNDLGDRNMFIYV
jgi:hypothetical protein